MNTHQVLCKYTLDWGRIKLLFCIFPVSPLSHVRCTWIYFTEMQWVGDNALGSTLPDSSFVIQGNMIYSAPLLLRYNIPVRWIQLFWQEPAFTRATDRRANWLGNSPAIHNIKYLFSTCCQARHGLHTELALPSFICTLSLAVLTHSCQS